ncbi:LAMI_0C04720g1_1 [Lachancea mirantina]|uniref:LAMI_0C04720g1_1 n=1 Tax=Lachancea mirantina TaxID=1230905 RepID=A0A1G4J294_9SACH|nr:LAMI_0C04720g1_1 [Lachancea mirantina]
MATDKELSKQLEAQRKAFEAQFGSLESMGFEDRTKIDNLGSEKSEDSEDGDNGEGESENESDSNWDSFEGFSDDEIQQSDEKFQERKPKVIKFQDPTDSYAPPTKQEQRLVRSGRAPKSALAESRAAQMAESKRVDSEDMDTEAENLKNDLELQRFLKESHLLSAFRSGSSGADLTMKTIDSAEYHDDALQGKARARTLEMRLNNLSATNGQNRKLEKVPMHVRKGMVNKHVKKIAKFEEDAREGGIVLSRVKKGEFRKIGATYHKDIERRIGQSIAMKESQRSAKRHRGPKIHSIGRSTRNGLVISQEEIRRINGTSSSGKSRGKVNGKPRRK